ncbi:DUF370 domain-containing protein [candidate division FCPU426 bacterium]|nr:DUF370 domain-containing protein [candidate division FCPU426 bacterium]
MDVTLIPIGYGNAVVAERIIAVIAPDSSPVKRLREEAVANGKLIDATHGRRTRAVIIMDSDHVILSALQPETISQRFQGEPAPEPGLEPRVRTKK